MNERLRHLQPHLRSWGLPALVIALGVLYPWYVETLAETPLVGEFVPALGSMVIMIVFTMMAVGLNVVVGYAGLLDLGYVAFYAAGAYTAAWFASQHFEQVTFHLGSTGVSSETVGIHLSIWLILIIAGALTAVAGILIAILVFRPEGLLGERTPEGA